MKGYATFFSQHFNGNTNKQYLRAIQHFLKYLTAERIALDTVTAAQVLAYAKFRTDPARGKLAIFEASIRPHISAIREFFNACVLCGALTANPAAFVKPPRASQKHGTTLVIEAAEVTQILDHISANLKRQADYRDRALVAILAYTFARIGGALSSRLKDFYFDDDYYWLDMTEKGEEEHLVPVPPAAAEKLREYIDYCALRDPNDWLFQSANRTGRLSGTPYDRSNSLAMIKLRSRTAPGTEINVKNHTFRATENTTALNRGKSYELIQEMPNQKDGETTKFYDRSRRARLAAEMKDFDYE